MYTIHHSERMHTNVVWNTIHFCEGLWLLWVWLNVHFSTYLGPSLHKTSPWNLSLLYGFDRKCFPDMKMTSGTIRPGKARSTCQKLLEYLWLFLFLSMCSSLDRDCGPEACRTSNQTSRDAVYLDVFTMCGHGPCRTHSRPPASTQNVMCVNRLHPTMLMGILVSKEKEWKNL